MGPKRIRKEKILSFSKTKIKEREKDMIREVESHTAGHAYSTIWSLFFGHPGHGTGYHAELRVVLIELLGQDHPTVMAARDVNVELMER